MKIASRWWPVTAKRATTAQGKGMGFLTPRRPGPVVLGVVAAATALAAAVPAAASASTDASPVVGHL